MRIFTKENIFRFVIAVIYLVIFLSIVFKEKTTEVKGKKCVLFWHAGSGDERVFAIKTLIKKFQNENPSICVKLKIIPWGEKPHDKIQIAIAGRDVPDIASVGSPFDRTIYDFGAVEVLNKYFDSSFFNDFVELGRDQKKVYSIPWFLDVRALIYRKDLFKKYGIPGPDGSWSWDDFLKYAKRLTVDYDGDGIIDLYGYGETARYAYQFLTFIWQNGGRLYSKDGKKVVVDSEESVYAVKFFVDLMKRYKVSPKFTTESLLIIRKMFAEGKIAMFMDCSDALKSFLKDERLKNKVGVGLLFYKKKRASYAGADSFVIFRDSKNKEDAVKFLKFLLRKDNMLYYALETGFSPSRRSVMRSKEILKDPLRAVFIKQAEYGVLWKIPPFTPTPKTILTKTVQQIIEGKYSVEEGLKRAREKMEKEIGILK